MIPLPNAEIMMADGKPRASGDDPRTGRVMVEKIA